MNNLYAFFKSSILHLGLLVFIGISAFLSPFDSQPIKDLNPVVHNRPIVEVELYTVQSQSMATNQTTAKIAGNNKETVAKTFESEKIGSKTENEASKKQESVKSSQQESKEKLQADIALKKQANEAAKKAQQLQENKEKAEKEKAEALKKAEDTKRQQALAEQKGNQIAGNINDKLRRMVQQNWYRPITARAGMTVILHVEFERNGRIRAVNINRSSGDMAFDRSAVQAMFNIGRIKEIANLDDKAFEKHFGRKLFTFAPNN
jgi:colicin import membrane protein